MPVLMAGSAAGANLPECSDTSGSPVRSLSVIVSAGIAPSRNMQIGTCSTVRPNSLKSSETMEG